MFFGIVIGMFYKDHEPAHFHAEYRNQQAKFTFDGELLIGEIRSRKTRERIRRWALEHRGELLANWENMKTGRPLEIIAPLQKPKP
jgi:hypothetical protein